MRMITNNEQMPCDYVIVTRHLFWELVAQILIY